MQGSRKRINPFDLFCVFFLLALIFTITVNLSKGKVPDESKNYEITVSFAKGSEVFPSSGVCFIDGKYEVSYTSEDGENLRFITTGIATDEGVFFFGAKYLCINQPIKISFGEERFMGRVTKILQI